jgi:hypothetical protein
MHIKDVRSLELMEVKNIHNAYIVMHLNKLMVLTFVFLQNKYVNIARQIGLSKNVPHLKVILQTGKNYGLLVKVQHQ